MKKSFFAKSLEVDKLNKKQLKALSELNAAINNCMYAGLCIGVVGSNLILFNAEMSPLPEDYTEDGNSKIIPHATINNAIYRTFSSLPRFKCTANGDQSILHTDVKVVNDTDDEDDDELTEYDN
jgi:hypothetical protein